MLKGELNKQPDIRVAIGNSHLDPIFEEINDLALEDHIPWLSIVPYDGQTSWVGPFSCHINQLVYIAITFENQQIFLTKYCDQT